MTDDIHDQIIITSQNKVMKKRRRITRQEVIKAAERAIQRYMNGDHSVKVYF